MAKIEVDGDLCLEEIDGAPGIVQSVFIGDSSEPAFEGACTFRDLLVEYVSYHELPMGGIREHDAEAIRRIFSNMINDIKYVDSVLVDFAKISTEPDSKEVRVYRYLRRDRSWLHDNMGGVAFLFKFTNYGDKKTEGGFLDFVVCICNTETNFDATKAKSILEDRARHQQWYRIPYDRNVDLIGNVYHALKDSEDRNHRKIIRAIETGCAEI
jgi:uncharacterized protein with ParB-like and HNH nuclease domain